MLPRLDGRRLHTLAVKAPNRCRPSPHLSRESGWKWFIKRGWMGVEYALFRTGPLTMAPSQVGLFTRSSPDYAT
jgi:hypothetical protein